MSRRSFCWTLAGVLVAPAIAIAQVSKAVRRIGALEPGMPDPPEDLWKQAEPLRALGWVEGQNLHVERRYDNGRPEALQALAEELVRKRVEIIVTGGTAATLAAKRVTTTIPIIIRTSADPVLTGLVASLARPGGNVTGYSEATPEVRAKYLSLVKELLPGLKRVGVLEEAGNPYTRGLRDQLQQTCRTLGFEPVFIEIATEGEIGGAIAEFVRQRAQVLILQGAIFFWDHRFEIVNAATNYHLPIVADVEEMVRDAGALMTYTSTSVEQNRVRAEYIDRILRGAKPADLPVQQPTKFVLVINLKTAKALGVAIPQSLLVRADEVIR